MAAYDYRMALVRGLVAPQKELQAEVRDLAGQSFKSEDWWNKQLDRQINEGFSETKTKEQYLKTAGPFSSGTYWADVLTGGVMMNRTPGAARTGIFGSNLGPTRRTVEYQEQKDLTAGQLKAIENQAKATSARVKRDAAKANKAGERKLRGSGGLMGRVKGNEKGLSAQLPELGSTGLGIEKVLL